MLRYAFNLENNIFDLHDRLTLKLWKPDLYESFSVSDPKPRRIHKATVRDRVLYQAVYRVLYQIFDSKFVFHSYSSREFKGTHKGAQALEKYIRKVTLNHSNPGFVLKCDIRKFFDSIDHNVLVGLIVDQINDDYLLILIKQIIGSFNKVVGKGLPLGNVTSQLFANIYMNELDQFIKRKLKAEHYVRYCDDFCILSASLESLLDYVSEIRTFCQTTLLLDMHPNKIIIRKIHSGVDFLGFVLLPHRKVLRTKTKRRILCKIIELKQRLNSGEITLDVFNQSVQSYRGVLSHCKGMKIESKIDEIISFFV